MMTEASSSTPDDTSIPDKASLWRRIPPWHFVKDENQGVLRPSTAAFEDHPNGTAMSVVLGDEVLEASRSPDSVLKGHEDFGLVSFTAGLAREKKQGVLRRPIEDEPAHAEVIGKKTNSVKKAFARNCTWVRQPDVSS